MYQGKLRLIKTDLLDPPIKEEDLYDKCCMICYDVATHPVHCSICKSIYCLKCASIWKSQNNQCPKKCQKPWQFVLSDSLNLTLMCPYGKECSKFLPQNIVEHLNICEAAPPQVKADLLRRREYLCEKDHKLEFWIGEFQMMMDVQCYQCKENTACRSICRKCNHIYCVNCRPPPCTKTKCPIGHNYIYANTTVSYVCDICGLKPALFNQNCYDDIKCNFGMCQSCHSRLPEVTTTTIAINNFQECQNMHNLKFLPDSEKGICSHCQNQQRLERCCKTCNTRYCLNCKPIRILKSKACLKKHTLKYVGEQEPQICTMCREAEASLNDEECEFSLCEECVGRLYYHAGNMERISGQYCSVDKHPLRDRLMRSECHDCKQLRNCLLHCYKCKFSYCIACRPSKFHKQDYYGNPYQFSVKQEKECSSCGNIVAETMISERCNVALCGACYAKI